LVERGILTALLNRHYLYNVYNIHDCLLSGRLQTMSSCMCSSAVASPWWQQALDWTVNTSNAHGSSVNKWCAQNRKKIVFVLILQFLLTITWSYTIGRARK